MADEAKGLGIIDKVDLSIEKARTKSLDLSLNELLDMYQGGELIIRPEYQRLFRWSEAKQSQFIESLLLEMPVPPIYVIEVAESRYELIDGLQRISTYMHFRGQQPDRVDDQGNMKSLVLQDCDIVHELNGLTFSAMPEALRIRLKRSFLHVEVVRKESDPRFRYYMFKRLNTGGELLSEQEIRNCTVRLLDNKFNEFIIELSKFAPFRRCVSPLTPEKFEQKYDEELVLRYFAMKNYRDKYEKAVADFLTEYMELVSVGMIPFDYEAESARFKKTFEILDRTMGERAFCAINDQGNSIQTFLTYYFEVFSLGIQERLEVLDPMDEGQIAGLTEKFVGIKRDPSFKVLTTGGGKNYASQLRKRIAFVADRV